MAVTVGTLDNGTNGTDSRLYEIVFGADADTSSGAINTGLPWGGGTSGSADTFGVDGTNGPQALPGSGIPAGNSRQGFIVLLTTRLPGTAGAAVLGFSLGTTTITDTAGRTQTVTTLTVTKANVANTSGTIQAYIGRFPRPDVLR